MSKRSRLSRPRIAVLLPALLLCVATNGVAQSILAGSVRSGGRPVRGADVRLEPAGIHTTTDSLGRFLLGAKQAGVARLSVRAVGYYPASRNMLIVANDSTFVNFVLDAVAQQLDSITVEARAASGSGRMAPFEERRRAGLGRFFTREMLAEREHATMADVLRMTTGLRLIARPPDCGGGYSVATGRGGAIQAQEWMRCGPLRKPMESACYFSIYLDGARYWVPGMREPPDINQLRVNGIQGMEVYRGPAEMPVQYQGTGSPCGAVLLWTRDGS
ncbi:MAG: carboxypeptidase regulatory-like domain-containing protein [Gemmatimonadales bacterium]